MLSDGEVSSQMLFLYPYSVFKGRYVSLCFCERLVTFHSAAVSPKADHK